MYMRMHECLGRPRCVRQLTRLALYIRQLCQGTARTGMYHHSPYLHGKTYAQPVGQVNGQSVVVTNIAHGIAQRMTTKSSVLSLSLSLSFSLSFFFCSRDQPGTPVQTPPLIHDYRLATATGRQSCSRALSSLPKAGSI